MYETFCQILPQLLKLCLAFGDVLVEMIKANNSSCCFIVGMSVMWSESWSGLLFETGCALLTAGCESAQKCTWFIIEGYYKRSMKSLHS